MEVISNGLASGYAVLFEEEVFTFPQFRSTSMELKDLHDAISASKLEIEALDCSQDQEDIFAAHLMMLDDPEVIKSTEDLIVKGNMNSGKAYETIMNKQVEVFESLEDPYFKERALDVKDLRNRVCRKLSSAPLKSREFLKETIIFANELTPSETAMVDKKNLKGFVTRRGGKSSHTAIIARSLEIPALVGGVEWEVKTGDYVLLDGLDGKVCVNPSDLEIKKFEEKVIQHKKQLSSFSHLIDRPTVTACGSERKIYANIAGLDDLKIAVSRGVDGIGLLRTEFFYLNNTSLPSEEEQFQFFKKCLHLLGDRPLTVRTVDIGGDKELPYLDLSKEDNPFLGVRGIRLCFTRPEIFLSQIRAILRASKFGNLKIMFPMVSTASEFIEAKKIVKREASILGVRLPELGVMIETPAAAITADVFSQYVDFVSIGTNDLIQYTTAADRMNQGVSHLYCDRDLAVWRLIENVCKLVVNKPVGMCGGMSSEEEHVQRLLAMGLDHFSVDIGKILTIKDKILSTVLSDAHSQMQLEMNHASVKKGKICNSKFISSPVGVSH